MYARIWLCGIAAPLFLSVAGTSVIYAAHREAGLAPVPYLLAGYLVGAGLWGIMRLMLPPRLCLATALIALAMGGIGLAQGSNAVAWFAGVPAFGGVAVTVPLGRKAGAGAG